MPTHSQKQEAEFEALKQLVNDTAASVAKLQTTQLTAESLMTLLDQRDQRLVASLKAEFSSPSSGILGSKPAIIVSSSESLVNVSSSETSVNVPSPCLTFPRFASGNPTFWLLDVSNYFKYYNTHPADRLLLTAMHLDGPAAMWYQGLIADNPSLDWIAFEQALLHCFRPCHYEDYTALLAKLPQTGTVLEYQPAFENLASKFQRFTSSHLISCVILDLQLHMRMVVQAHRPVDLPEDCSLAGMYEAQSHEQLRPFTLKPMPTPFTRPMKLGSPSLPNIDGKPLSRYVETVDNLPPDPGTSRNAQQST